MNTSIIDSLLVIVLLLNFYVLGISRLRLLITAVAFHGALLGLLYPAIHGDLLQMPMPNLFRLVILTFAIVGLKGWLIPHFLFRAVRLADMESTVSSLIGFAPTMVVGALVTVAALAFSSSLPQPENQPSRLLIPVSLATVMCGYILLATRREALAQVLGYIVLENGIFVFGLLLIEAVPLLVEFGVVLDLFVGVFVMGIIINHVSRAFPTASTEHLTNLKEQP